MFSDLVSAGYISSSYSIWMGADDILREGSWRWSNGASRPYNAQWHHGEPNDGHGEEDCASGSFSSAARKMMMNDVKCSSKLEYICERVVN